MSKKTFEIWTATGRGRFTYKQKKVLAQARKAASDYVKETGFGDGLVAIVETKNNKIHVYDVSRGQVGSAASASLDFVYDKNSAQWLDFIPTFLATKLHPSTEVKQVAVAVQKAQAQIADAKADVSSSRPSEARADAVAVVEKALAPLAAVLAKVANNKDDIASAAATEVKAIASDVNAVAKDSRSTAADIKNALADAQSNLDSLGQAVKGSFEFQYFRRTKGLYIRDRTIVAASKEAALQNALQNSDVKHAGITEVAIVQEKISKTNGKHVGWTIYYYDVTKSAPVFIHTRAVPEISTTIVASYGNRKSAASKPSKPSKAAPSKPKRPTAAAKRPPRAKSAAAKRPRAKAAAETMHISSTDARTAAEWEKFLFGGAYLITPRPRLGEPITLRAYHAYVKARNTNTGRATRYFLDANANGSYELERTKTGKRRTRPRVAATVAATVARKPAKPRGKSSQPRGKSSPALVAEKRNLQRQLARLTKRLSILGDDKTTVAKRKEIDMKMEQIATRIAAFPVAAPRAHGKPSKPRAGKPSKPRASKPRKPRGVSKPSKPRASKPRKPRGVSKPSKPRASKPVSGSSRKLSAKALAAELKAQAKTAGSHLISTVSSIVYLRQELDTIQSLNWIRKGAAVYEILTVARTGSQSVLRGTVLAPATVKGVSRKIALWLLDSTKSNDLLLSSYGDPAYLAIAQITEQRGSVVTKMRIDAYQAGADAFGVLTPRGVSIKAKTNAAGRSEIEKLLRKLDQTTSETELVLPAPRTRAKPRAKAGGAGSRGRGRSSRDASLSRSMSHSGSASLSGSASFSDSASFSSSRSNSRSSSRSAGTSRSRSASASASRSRSMSPSASFSSSSVSQW